MTQLLPVAAIHPDPDQPRKTFKPEALRELAASLKADGLLQAITVRRNGQGYSIVMGERRWRAAQLAGLTEIEAKVVEVSAARRAILALMENLHRADLEPLDESDYLARLLAHYGDDEERLAAEIAKPLAYVRDSLRLQNLAAAMRDALQTGAIGPMHARQLAKLPKDSQPAAYRKLTRMAFWEWYRMLDAQAAALAAPTQDALFALPAPDPRRREIVAKYDRLLDGVERLVHRSFSRHEVQVLASVVDGELPRRLDRLELVLQHLGMIRGALLDAQAHKHARARRPETPAARRAAAAVKAVATRAGGDR